MPSPDFRCPCEKVKIHSAEEYECYENGGLWKSYEEVDENDEVYEDFYCWNSGKMACIEITVEFEQPWFPDRYRE